MCVQYRPKRVTTLVLLETQRRGDLALRLMGRLGGGILDDATLGRLLEGREPRSLEETIDLLGPLALFLALRPTTLLFR
jgi:hypothetical protein